MRLTKSIPAGAGMGGGSSDAAATLSALNVVWGMDRPRTDLMRLAAELGSDVPYFLCGGTAIGTGRGEEVYPLEDAPRLGVVVIKPSFSVSTADAYAWLDADREAGAEARRRPPRAVDLGWLTGGLVVENDLESPVGRRHPDIATMVDACLSQGARVAAMTGSGSAVFGLFDGTAAARAARKLQRPDWLVMVTRTLTRRESGRSMGL
jgi:4-diphosphocytidyl-2-C-methyl-D-erythritol kinase